MKAYFIDKLKFLTEASAQAGELRNQVQTYLNKLIPNRLQSKTNIFNTVLDVTEDQTNLMYGYLADAMRENNALAAQHDVSVRGHAELSGHSAVRPISARGVVTLLQKTSGLQRYGSAVIFTEDAKFVCKTNSLTYVINSKQPIIYDLTNNYVSIPIIEGTKQTQTFTVDSSKMYTVHLDDEQPIEHYSVSVKVNGTLYKRADNISSAPLNSPVYVVRNGFNNQVDLVFGTDTHGIRLSEGDIIEVSYLTTNGAYGNIDSSAEFELTTGVTDMNGTEIDVNAYVQITYESGFQLGSNGENIEITRSMCGFVDRALTFSTPDSVKEYLSRVTTLSHIAAWTDADDRIFNILALPKLTFTQASDYFYTDLSKFTLKQEVKDELILMLSESRRQIIGDEIVFVDPVIKQYSIFIYVDATFIDSSAMKKKIENAVASYMMSKTFGEVDLSQSDDIISKSKIVDTIYDMSEINRVSVTIYSKDNETARIAGKYIEEVEVLSGAIRTTVTNDVTLESGENPNLGLSDIGDIVVNTNEIPIIRGGFDLYNANGNISIKDSGIHIFYRNNNTWTEL